MLNLLPTLALIIATRGKSVRYLNSQQAQQTEVVRELDLYVVCDYTILCFLLRHFLVWRTNWDVYPFNFQLLSAHKWLIFTWTIWLEVKQLTNHFSALICKHELSFLLIIWKKQNLFATWVHLYFIGLDIDLFLITIATVYIFFSYKVCYTLWSYKYIPLKQIHSKQSYFYYLIFKLFIFIQIIDSDFPTRLCLNSCVSPGFIHTDASWAYFTSRYKHTDSFVLPAIFFLHSFIFKTEFNSLGLGARYDICLD